MLFGVLCFPVCVFFVTFDGGFSFRVCVLLMLVVFCF